MSLISILSCLPIRFEDGNGPIAQTISHAAEILLGGKYGIGFPSRVQQTENEAGQKSE